MSIWQTILVFVVIPAAGYGLIALLATGGRAGRTPRYRPGQQWTYEPVWWMGNPEGIGKATQDVDADRVDAALTRTAKGGARGSW